MRRTRPLGWAIAGGSAVCLVAVLVLSMAIQARSPKNASAIPALRVIPSSSRQPSQRISSAPPATATHRYEQLPLAFEPAGTASTSDTKFLARGDGYALFLTPSETVLALGKHFERSAALRLKMVGANATPSFVASDELPGKSNYILGSSPARWRTNVPNYGKVAERGIYDGVDVVYYGNQRQLEYDFVIASGADPGVIQIAFQGAKALRIDPAGDLIASTAGGDVRLHKAIAYQGTGDAKHEVGISYIMKSAHSVSFQLSAYDASQQLIIDPVLSYSTYLGGSDIDGANAIAVAPDNTAFVAGGTFSTDFPTAHPLQPNIGGPHDFPKDAFVTKISADGSTLLYSTYLGGSNQDVANGIAVDDAGDAYVTGTTLSSDFPVTPGSFNTICGADGKCGATLNPTGLIVSGCFVTKLNPAGSGIIYSGFLGEYENVRCQAIAVESSGTAYVTGQAGPAILVTTAPPQCPKAIPPSTTPPPCFFPFPTTTGVALGTSDDAFVTKISASGSTLLYSSLLGGSGEEIGYGIAADSSGNAYATGLTYSTDFPISSGAVQSTNAGAGDAFVTRISTGQSGLPFYSTYLGGSGLDQGNGLAIDSNGNIYIAGGTSSGSLFPSVAGYEKTYHDQGDAFVAKLNPALTGLSGLVYFTYLGGSKADSAAGIAIDPQTNAYVTGSTVSTDLLALLPSSTSGTFQRTYGGGNADAFVAELGPTGTTLIYASFLGGTDTEIAGGVAVDTSGPPFSAYVAGQTCSQDFPLSNPLQGNQAGNCDAFISKIGPLGGVAINPAGLVFASQTLNTTSAPQTVTLTNTNDSAAINIISIVKSGSNAGEFTQTSTCGASLPAGAQCAVTVTFRPGGIGTRTAQITLTDNSQGSSQITKQVLNLNGSASTNPDFALSDPQPSFSVNAGQIATYTVTLSPVAGFSQPVSVSCAGLPREASCSISPNPVIPNGTTPVALMVTVSTTTRTSAPPSFQIKLRPDFFTGLQHFGTWLALLFVLFIPAAVITLRHRLGTLAFGLTIVLLLLAPGCSGGGQAGIPAGTPAGNYQYTVTATSGSVTHSMPLNLQVN